MKLKRQMDAIYGEWSPDRIPWNLAEPPDLLVELVESGRVQPCDAVDLGCGTGNYAVWLAGRGFRVTGLDISSKAIELAENLARKRGVKCRFMVEDLTGEMQKPDQSFDFAFDWEVLHHVFPQDREQYIRNARLLLRPGGRYLSVCFSEQDPDFGGRGKSRKTPLGTTLYFSSEEELRRLFESKFRILELRTSEVPGKHGPHKAVVGLMERE